MRSTQHTTNPNHPRQDSRRILTSLGSQASTTRQVALSRGRRLELVETASEVSPAMSPEDRQPSRRARHRLRGKSGPVASGWAPVGAGPVVVAIFDADALPNALAKLHAEGYGEMARVLDANRGDVNVQLHRLGIDNDLGLSYAHPSSRVLVVRAAGRSKVLGDLLLTAGASDVRIIMRESTIEAPSHPGEGTQTEDQEARDTV